MDLSAAPQAEKLMHMVRPLGQYYGDRVPMAALYLEDQIQSGVVRLAVTGDPGAYRQMSISEFAADVTNVDLQAQVREASPGLIGEEAISLTEQEAAAILHRFIADGMYLMDDDHCLHLTASLAEIL